ncbi:MAG: ABC-F family ATP-binding cassette domain-containing protein [Muribaculum sp.]|nr:ABC-F family ATP-binding cassette domain-containing protein [Muribaculaceae bacterium]MCM1081762.1 ABC-F family ATP-binding cassette domain-containing protein [Muribaculum sp.]
MATSFLQVEQLTKSYGDRMLFADVTFGVNEGDKIALIAKNGTGKTTLLSILAGKESPDSGTVTFRSGLVTGFLEQTPDFEPTQTVLEVCLRSDNQKSRAITTYEAALACGENGDLTAAIAEMDAAQAWEYDDQVKQVLGKLGINNLEQKIGEMSGGQVKRVALARVILGSPDLIILDEPTNHLDIEAIEWLENYLKSSRVTLLMVTHDRYFLDRVTNKIIEIDDHQIYTYQGNYAYYIDKREQRIEALAAEKAKLQNTLRRELQWMRRQPQARGGKAKYRIDAYHSMNSRNQQIRLSEKQLDLGVKSTYIGSKIFEAKNVSKAFGDKVVLRDFNYVFARYERVGIIGRNGVGKSTFIKMLQGLIAPDSGMWDIGETVNFGYYSQDGVQLDPGKKVIDAVTDLAEDIVVNGGVRYSPMQFLQHFLFPPADQQKYVAKLSGGEKARLHLALVLMRSPNFLILDEPTNDLDIVTLGILEEYLETFNGCLIVVSHDRFFLDSIIDHLFVFEGDGKVRDFPGNYSDYRKQISEASQPTPTAKSVVNTDTRQPRQRNENKMNFKERREFEELTRELEQLNAELMQLDNLFQAGGATEEIEKASIRYPHLKDLIDEKEMRWLELSEKS